MSDNIPRDRDHLMSHVRILFPDATINLIYAPDEIIHIDLDNHRFTFEIGSDDYEYVFTDGKTTFAIPLMDWDQDF
jgi:hypothetical protein